jgi:hypothetical protein
MALYFVLPRQDVQGLLRCTYYDNEGNEVPGDGLDAHAQGHDADFLCLRQLQAPSGDPGASAFTLLAGVAKTLRGNCGLPNTFLADAGGRLVLPVMPGTRRGLILVFTVTSTLGVQALVATSDPEIKNTSGGEVGGPPSPAH